MQLTQKRDVKQEHDLVKIFNLLWVFQAVSGCYFVDYFNTSKTSQRAEVQILSQDTVLGNPLGRKAGSLNQAALDEVHKQTSSVPPATIRPDPDLFARNLLLQHRKEGLTVAKLMGSVEAYRPLLGGASVDFQKTPQEEFDATSLLATFSVAKTVCQALVAPIAWQHGDWQTILPSPPDQWEANIKFLVQRITARPSGEITQGMLLELKDVMDREKSADTNRAAATANGYQLQHYVPVCSVLTIDPKAQSL